MNVPVTIVIPTYNRAICLGPMLKVLLPLCEKYSIPVCVFDNASTDITQHICEKLSLKFAALRYFRHTENIGGAGNIIHACTSTIDAEYVWLLSDHMMVSASDLDRIMEAIKWGGDLFCVGIKNYPTFRNYSSTCFNDIAQLDPKLVAEIVFHLSNISSNLFRKETFREGLIDAQRDLAKLSYPHLAIFRQAYKSHMGFKYINSEIEFMLQSERRYDWLESGFLRFGEIVKDNLGLKNPGATSRHVLFLDRMKGTAVREVLLHVSSVGRLKSQTMQRIFRFYGLNRYTFFMAFCNIGGGMIARRIWAMRYGNLPNYFPKQAF
jgi:glycosyltransferase involved in cell wall biosynthesis